MIRGILKTGAVALMAGAAFVGAANAGGFNRGTADTDILFETGRFVSRNSVTVVAPSLNIDSIAGAPASGYKAATYMIPSFAAKVGVSDNVSCAGTYTTPFGANSTYAGLTIGGAPVGSDPLSVTGSVSQEFITREFGATCAIGFNVGKGRLSILGGVFLETLDFNQVIALGAYNFHLEDTGYGYRAGVAYEIPEIAFRTQLMYRSAVTHDATGNVTLVSNGAVLVPNAIGNAPFPQSVEFKLQTGVAPGWLVYGGVKWTDWSVFQSLNYTATAPSSLNFFWRDGWTINAGVAHSFTDKLAGTVGLTWDNGTSVGYDLSSLETWTLSSGVSYKANDAVEIRAGAGYSWIAAGTQNYYDSGAPGVSTPLPGAKHQAASHAVAGSLSLRIKF